MLAPWIFYNAVDDGIEQDYAAYRQAHRDILHQYLADYQIAPAPAP